MNTLEDRLKFIRKKAGFSQKKLAEKTGITQRTLQRHEKDASVLTVKIATNISRLCGVDLIWLLTGQGSMEESAEDLSNNLQSDKIYRFDKITKNHQGIIPEFEHKEDAMEINQDLLKIDKKAPNKLNDVKIFIKGILIGLQENEDNEKKNMG